MTGFLRQNLPELIRRIPIEIKHQASLPDVPVTGITFDSRQVRPGTIFVALSGGNTDGHKYIPQALEKGAVAIVGSQELPGLNSPYLLVDDTRLALAHLSAAFYQFPARHLTVIGVTGTDGKTTTSNLIYNILLSAGIRAGIISTVNAVIGDETVDTGFHVTTPEAPEVQQYLARMLAAGLTHVVLESTSHGLAQHRVTGCEFDLGVVTNITHEHLDYHGTYEAYREAKGRLFTDLALTHPKEQGNPRMAVLNRDDQSYEYLKQVNRTRQVTYSLKPGADIWAENIRYASSGLQFDAVGAGFHIPIQSRMVGSFNVSNILAALGATMIGLRIPIKAVQAGIAGLTTIPGRMEAVDLGQQFMAIVDFAHTPNALLRALESARQMTGGKVVAVFGSAGLRDRQKRRMMARISIQQADYTILTAEDPRTESLDDILAEMADEAQLNGGVEGQTFWRAADRGDAIRQALRLAGPGDVVISCGKGHEQSMCFGETEYPWDDRTAMHSALAEYLGIAGPDMPYLPTRGSR